jgi:aminomuconate-semialdehyde/2-hydroxymuconate-6-semialdehyde dehydrogenase
MASPSELPKLQNFINGKFQDALDGTWLDDFNPATGQVHALVARSKAADVEAAVAAAEAARAAWAATPFTVRASYLDKIADEIERQASELASLESRDSGKTLTMATNVDIPRAVSNFRFFAGQVRHDQSHAHMMADAVNYDLREPIGICGLITPWNLPLYLLSWKVAPALACGNCVVAKPSEITPMTATALARIVERVGLPAGVFNLVHGFGHECGGPLVSHPDVRCVSFTGGTVTGKVVASLCAPLFKKVSLELGGKNSTVIFDDVPLEKAVAAAKRSAFTNNGQVCLAGSRVFVQRGLYDAFVPAFAAAVGAMKCADPLTPGADIGPVSSAAHKAKILSYIELAKTEGGKIECGGGTPEGLPASSCDGYFVAPTVISGLAADSRVSTEEIFGPVCTVHPFDYATGANEDEIANLVNNTCYGLACSVWTERLTVAHRLARRIHTGIVWVNCWLHRDLRTPFGGVKDSGLGREGGLHSLEFYTEAKNVCVYTGPL